MLFYISLIILIESNTSYHEYYKVIACIHYSVLSITANILHNWQSWYGQRRKYNHTLLRSQWIFLPNVV